MKERYKIIFWWIVIAICSFLVTESVTAQTFGYGNHAKDYVYLKASFDPNNAFGITDNPRTEVQSTGFDYDIELGARYKTVGVYVFYGSFQEINYYNYGAGVDLYVNIFNKVDTSLGANMGVIGRKYGDDWGASFAPAVRAITTIWIVDDLGIVLTAQGQNRPDINKNLIFEGSIGLMLKIDRK